MLENLINFILPSILGVYLYYKNPINLTILFPAFIYLKFGIWVGNTILYASDIFSFLMILSIIKELFTLPNKFKFDFGGKLILIFTLFFVTNIVIGRNHDTYRFLLDYFLLFVSFLFYTIKINKNNISLVVKNFAIAKLIIVTYSILYLLFPKIFPSAYSVSYGVYETDTMFRFSLLQHASFLFLYSIVFYKGFKSVFLLILTFTLVLISGSRTHAIICLVLFLYFLFWNLYYKGQIIRIIRTAIIVLFIALVGKEFLNTPKLQKWTARYEILMSDPISAGGGRESYFENSIKASQKNLLLGNEILNAKVLSRDYDIDWVHVYTGRTHNVYLAVLYAFGIVGLSIILIMVLSYFFFTFQGFKQVNRKYLLFLHLVIASAMIEGFTAGVYYSYIADALIIALVMHIKLNTRNNLSQ